MNQQTNLPLYLTYTSYTFTNMKDFSTYLEEYMWVGGKVVEQKYQDGEEKKKRKMRNEGDRKKWEIEEKRRKKMM